MEYFSNWQLLHAKRDVEMLGHTNLMFFFVGKSNDKKMPWQKKREKY